jgi:hypothetical protein
LFGELKREMAEFTASSTGDIFSEIRQILETIPKEIPTLATRNGQLGTMENTITEIKRNASALEMSEKTAGDDLLEPFICAKTPLEADV